MIAVFFYLLESSFTAKRVNQYHRQRGPCRSKLVPAAVQLAVVNCGTSELLRSIPQYIQYFYIDHRPNRCKITLPESLHESPPELETAPENTDKEACDHEFQVQNHTVTNDQIKLFLLREAKAKLQNGISISN